jgi:hypothetical protein
VSNIKKKINHGLLGHNNVNGVYNKGFLRNSAKIFRPTNDFRMWTGYMALDTHFIVHYCVFQKHLYVKLILNFKLLLDTFFHKVKTN